MLSDPVIDFAQNCFGRGAGLPPEAEHRPRVPTWVAAAMNATFNQTKAVAISPVAVLAEGDAPIRMEGRIPKTHEPEPASDGTDPDAYAFYLPFHFYRTTWGIYIRAAGVSALARRFAAPRKRPDANDLAVAYDALLEHERFHFLTEYAASRIEVVTLDACYSGYFHVHDASLHEEAIANAYALKAIRRRAPAHLAQAVEHWMAAQAPGYRDFREWLPSSFISGQRLLVWAMTPEPAARALARPNPVERTPEFLYRGAPTRRVPVYIVLDQSVPWVRVIRPFPKQFGLQVLVHYNDHNPPHIHIECPPGTDRCRYKWPELTPYGKDSPLRAKEEKLLRKYVEVHGRDIAKRSKIRPGSDPIVRRFRRQHTELRLIMYAVPGTRGTRRVPSGAGAPRDNKVVRRVNDYTSKILEGHPAGTAV